MRFGVKVWWFCCLAVLIGGGTSFSLTTSFVSIAPSAVVLQPGQTFQFKIVRAGDSAAGAKPRPVFMVNGKIGGSPSTGTITSEGLYTAPTDPPAPRITITVLGDSSSAIVTLFDPSNPSPGLVRAVANPLVAAYRILTPVGASVHVQFGPDTGYGLSTSTVSAPSAGGEVKILVAGMRASTTYHMQAVVGLADGSQLLDVDHAFTTGPIPAGRLPKITAQQSGIGTPSPGIELFSLLPSPSPTHGKPPLTAVATDLEGNVIWYYNLNPTQEPFPIKPLPNGHMLVLVSPPLNSSGFGVPGFNEVREIDLAGNIINRVSPDDVNAQIPSLVVYPFSHDVAILPNGHWILLGSTSKIIRNVRGIRNGTILDGDVLVDWDPQRRVVVWSWSAFDHIPLTHAPWGYPDWTHGNAVIYSPDDKDLILSMRAQNWIVKIDYRDGKGDGRVLWHLGPDGDFTLPNGEAPTEWNYGQHYVNIVSPNSSGVFSLMFFNNGNNRLLGSDDAVCGTPGAGPCYSTVPIFQLDESAKTATILWEDNLAPSFSVCCGDAFVLPNGDVEYDVAFDVTAPGFSRIEEVTQTVPPQTVWKMFVQNQLAYRGYRIPSLYPGQVWPAPQ